jgi:hypothetical protein
MSSGERAPLCGYINKPSFSIVIIIFYQLFIFYILPYNCIHGYLLHWYQSRSVLPPPKKKPHNPYHKITPSLPPYPSHPVSFSISRKLFPTKFLPHIIIYIYIYIYMCVCVYIYILVTLFQSSSLPLSHVPSCNPLTPTPVSSLPVFPFSPPSPPHSTSMTPHVPSRPPSSPIPFPRNPHVPSRNYKPISFPPPVPFPFPYLPSLLVTCPHNRLPVTSL